MFQVKTELKTSSDYKRQSEKLTVKAHISLEEEGSEHASTEEATYPESIRCTAKKYGGV